MKSSQIAAVVLAIIALVHLLRLMLGWAFIVGTLEVPMWPSALVAILFGALAKMLWKEGRA